MSRHLLFALALGACSPQGDHQTKASAPPSASASSAAAPAAAPSSSTPLPPLDPKSDSSALYFKRDGKQVAAFSRKELLATIKTTIVEAYDPYYSRTKRFRALPTRAVLEKAFPGLALENQHFILEAVDGYKVPIDGKRLLQKGGHIAVQDIDVPAWEPIGQQQANPGPFYMVWANKGQQDLKTHPRPWQLSIIAIASFADSYPKTIPAGAGPAAQAGFKLFVEQCIRCHAINRQGGRVGPELNVPQSLVDYRPEAQIRAFIKNPLTFRYGNMPANPHLTEKDLDHLLAYLRAMSTRKHDPKNDKAGH